jgi:hypothetical protein
MKGKKMKSKTLRKRVDTSRAGTRYESGFQKQMRKIIKDQSHLKRDKKKDAEVHVNEKAGGRNTCVYETPAASPKQTPCRRKVKYRQT